LEDWQTEENEIDTEEFLRLVYDQVQGFAYLDSLAGEPRSYYLPLYLTDLIEEATWSLGGNLYCSTNTFTDGRIEHYNDEDGKRKISTGRQKANAKEGGAIYCDADTAHPDVFRLQPSIVVESSPGRWQCWWILDDVYPASRIALLARQIAYAHNAQGADISSSSLTKLLRVPGSRNAKRNRETGEYVHADLPTVRAWDTGARYTIEEIESKYEDIEYIRSLMPESDDVELPDRASLPAFPDLYNALPEIGPFTGTEFGPLIEGSNWLDETGQRKPGPSGDRTRYRYRLICDLIREGYSNEDVLVLAWGAKASDKWRADPRGERGLWGEILKARIEINAEQGEGLDVLEADDAYQPSEIGLSLLDDKERALIKGDPHFVNRYLAWVRSRLSRANMPYHRLNAWMVLSIAYSELTAIPDESADYPLNIWTLALGETATGKTQASDMMFEMAHHVHEDGFWGDGVNVGGNATPSALNKVLIERDKKVSVFQSDEAHGPLAQIQKAEYQAGSLELYTYLYDGRVPKYQRMTNAETSNKDATTIFNMWLLGPPKQVTDVIPADWFSSGFMGRFMMAIGDPPDPKKKTAIKRREGDLSVKRLDPFVAQLAEESEYNREEFRERGMPYLDETDEALERMSRAVDGILEHSAGNGAAARSVEEASRRFEKHIRKAAWLLALSEASPVVTLRHALIAIEAAEGWYSAMIEIAGMVSENPYVKQGNAIEEAIRDNKGWMSVVKINDHFRHIERRVRTEHLQDLVSQNRLKPDNRNGVAGYKTLD
jgi:hypothetical protein